MPDNNAGDILRFEHGGQIIITPEGGTAQTVLNIISGTLQIVPTMFTALPPDIDRGVPNADIRKGDKQSGTLAFNAKFTSTVGSDELYEILTAVTTDQNMKKHGIVVNYFTDTAQTTGRSFTLSNAVVSDRPTISAGNEYDMINASFITPSDIAIAAIAP